MAVGQTISLLRAIKGKGSATRDYAGKGLGTNEGFSKSHGARLFKEKRKESGNFSSVSVCWCGNGDTTI